eukprot:10244006-Prorocentrum_lima.AAC.1
MTSSLVGSEMCIRDRGTGTGDQDVFNHEEAYYSRTEEEGDDEWGHRSWSRGYDGWGQHYWYGCS